MSRNVAITEILFYELLNRNKVLDVYKRQKERQLISGIHFNFSFSEKLMDVLLKSGVCGSSMEEVRETVYFLSLIHI